MKYIGIKELVSIGFLLLCVGALNASAFTDNTVTWLQNQGINPYWIVIIISILPVIELRGAIPVAILLFKIPWATAVLLSVLGNMLPIAFLLLFLDLILKLLSKVSWGKRFADWMIQRAETKGKSLQRYQALGLIIFVGIPLPGTGAWTGSLIASVFKFRFWHSLFYIFLGVLMAAAIVTPLTLLGLLAAS